MHYEMSKWSQWPAELIDIWPFCLPERALDKRYHMTLDWNLVDCKRCLAKKGERSDYINERPAYYHHSVFIWSGHFFGRCGRPVPFWKGEASMVTFASIRKRLEAATPGLKTVERLDGDCEESFRYEIHDKEHLIAFYEDNHKQRMRAKFNAELYAHATTDIETLLKAVDVLTDAVRNLECKCNCYDEYTGEHIEHCDRCIALARIEEMAGEKE